MGWIILLPSLAVWRILSKRVNVGGGGGATVGGRGARGGGGGGGGARGKLRSILNVVVMLTAAVAGFGLALTWVAGWLVKPFSWGGHNLQVALAAAVIILAVGTALVDIGVDRQADKPAQWAAFLAPTFVLLLAGGFVGATGDQVSDFVVANVGAWFQNLGSGS
jgi:hypothetical protein